MTNKTDRELWIEPAPSMNIVVRREAVSAGLQALAEAWFEDYSDETDLPAWFNQAVEYADQYLGDLDIPARDDEDDD